MRRFTVQTAMYKSVSGLKFSSISVVVAPLADGSLQLDQLSEVRDAVSGDHDTLDGRQPKQILKFPLRTIGALGNDATGAIGGGVAAGATPLFADPTIALAMWRGKKPQDHFFDVPVAEGQWKDYGDDSGEESKPKRSGK
ncbi:hypothetical protein Vadar_009217 [Vaccinium darrowii]|uniref:Uncharacterized protein n=1 Tax=Vaccinium darrowii TaxID=229202 RepID=A0ACB7YDP9_9ERIC|nr:hypothetical protein Vadar_009217 [Vaccinium darrowii]